MFVSWENVREIKQKEKLERKKEKMEKKKRDLKVINNFYLFLLNNLNYIHFKIILNTFKQNIKKIN